MSYGKLKDLSNQMAALLSEHGIREGSLVGVGLNRCLELPAVLLGILKNGAAYVPLDPGYPALRLAQMVSSAGLEHVITSPEMVDLFPGATTLTMDERSLSKFSKEPCQSRPTGNSRIYAIFTSGSTGTPKAASVFHRGFSNLLDWYGAELALGPQDCALVISSPSFDLTQKNFYAPLINGGTLVLDDQTIYDIPRIIRLIREHSVTLINCTPSAFYPLVDAAAGNGFKDLSSLRFAVLGGEPISIPRLRSWLEHTNCHAEVVNSYGPTECTDISLFHRLHAGNLDEFPFVPLGREIPNVEVTIRDEQLHPLADGEVGELCIQGIGVGDGYLNDPEKTGDCFTKGMYRSGDLAKRLPCGTFEFRGRADHQVKVNGFRIELGEIELALSKHQGVREAVVIAGEGRLIAHIQGTASALELRAHLTSLLPGYMVPAEYHVVEAFPLTPNGKVDRKEMTRQAISGKTASLNAGNGSEAKILALWSEILNRPIEDATANFFDLGGNSIHLAVMHVRLQQMTGRDFPLTELFALPTVRSISAFLAPQAATTNTPSPLDRARLAQAGFSRFRRSPSR